MADRRGLVLLGLLFFSLTVFKEGHFPEAWVGGGLGRGRFDFSLLHSHALWHCGVFLVQVTRVR